MSRSIGVTEWLVDVLPEWSLDAFAGITLLGDLLLIVPALALLYLTDVGRRLRASASAATVSGEHEDIESLCSDRTAFVVAVVFGGLALVVGIEAVFSAPRPPAEWHAIDSSEHGFPSGHTMAATIFWGALALWGRTGRHSSRFALAGAFVALVALSRLALGVHYAVDVIASVVFGVGYLLVVARVTDGRPGRAFIAAVVVAVIAIVATGGTSRALLAFVGTVGAGMGWWLTERPIVRSRLQSLTRRLTATPS